MKLRTLLLLSFSFISSQITLSACSFETYSFCMSSTGQMDDVILSGYISAVDSTGINVTVLQVLRGTEDRSNIRIWDGTDFDCNGFFSMAAEDIGALNDTLVLLLPLIDTIQNNWDQIGDYRRPDPYSRTTSLKVTDGILNGLISGWGWMDDAIFSFPFDEFVSKYLNENDCSSITSIQDIKGTGKLTIMNPFMDEIIINTEENLVNTTLTLFDLNGVECKEDYVANARIHTMSVGYLPAGLYFLQVQRTDAPPEIIKLYKRG